MPIADRSSAPIDDAQRYRMLVEAITDYAIYMLDPDGLVTSWNSGAQRLKGYSVDEIIGHHFSRFYTPEDIEAGLPARGLERARTQGKSEIGRLGGAQGWLSVLGLRRHQLHPR